MSTVSSSPAALMLSEEAQDLICYHLLSFKNTDAMNTLYSLALTSKAFLESAQHALYKAPLRALLARPTWSRTEALLLTLKTRPGLALHIRELSTLDEMVQNLSLIQHPRATENADKPAGSQVGIDRIAEPSKEAAYRKAFELAELVRNTTSISMVASSEAQVQHSSEILTSLSRVTTLRLSTERAVAMHYDSFTKWVASWSGRKMKKVTFVGLEWVDLPLKGSKLGIPISAQEISVEESHLSAFQLLFCLPRTLKPLKKLRIASYGQNYRGMSDPKALASLEALFKLAGKGLRTFSFSALHQYEVHSEIEEYDFSHDGPTLPLAAFQAFPVVTSLTLRYLSGMTPATLAALARASPKIKILDLKWTTWNELALDGVEASLIAALDIFGRLKKLDLGYFPINEDNPWELNFVMEWAKVKGIELELQGCWVPFSGEDGYGQCGGHDFDEVGYDVDDLCYDPECDGECGFSHEYDFE